MQSIYVGIDPGQKGAVGVIYADGNVAVYPVPIYRVKTGAKTKSGAKRVKTEYAEAEMADLLVPLAKLHYAPDSDTRVLVVLENAQVRECNGKFSAYGMGLSVGLWRGILGSFRLPFLLVPPSVWRPKMVGAHTDKAASVLMAKRLWPEVEFPHKNSDGLAEALLIAEFARRKMAAEQMPAEEMRRGSH